MELIDDLDDDILLDGAGDDTLILDLCELAGLDPRRSGEAPYGIDRSEIPDLEDTGMPLKIVYGLSGTGGAT